MMSPCSIQQEDRFYLYIFQFNDYLSRQHVEYAV